MIVENLKYFLANRSAEDPVYIGSEFKDHEIQGGKRATSETADDEKRGLFRTFESTGVCRFDRLRNRCKAESAKNKL